MPRLVEVEEPARAADAAVVQLDEVDAVEGHEAVAAGQRARAAPVRAGSAPRDARVVLVADPRPGALEPQVGERARGACWRAPRGPSAR